MLIVPVAAVQSITYQKQKDSKAKKQEQKRKKKVSLPLELIPKDECIPSSFEESLRQFSEKNI